MKEVGKGEGIWSYLGYGVKGSTDVEDALWITGNAFRHHNTSPTLLPYLVYMRTAFTDDDGRVLSNYQAAHMDIGCGRSCSE